MTTPQELIARARELSENDMFDHVEELMHELADALEKSQRRSCELQDAWNGVNERAEESAQIARQRGSWLAACAYRALGEGEPVEHAIVDQADILAFVTERMDAMRSRADQAVARYATREEQYDARAKQHMNAEARCEQLTRERDEARTTIDRYKVVVAKYRADELARMTREEFDADPRYNGQPEPECPECHWHAAPRGRSSPMECPGCNCVPGPERGSLWPNETREQFGYPQGLVEESAKLRARFYPGLEVDDD